MSDELYLPFPKQQIEYRLYYDAQGRPVAMASHDYPVGNYIVITREQYERPNYNVRVTNGKIVVDTSDHFHVQLKQSNSGVAVVRGHASIVLENDTYEEIEYYDRIS
jgi:hypothetical protein